MAVPYARQKRDGVIRTLHKILRIGREAKVDIEQREDFAAQVDEIKELKQNFHAYQAQYEDELEAREDGDALEEQFQIRERFDDELFEIKTLIRKLRVSHEVTDDQAREPKTPSTVPNIRLPKISLPTFNGDLSTWNHFADIFKNLIHHNASLIETEKFQYLNSCLTNEPLNLIKNLPITSYNYETAWELLETRYSNQRLIATSHVDKILSLANLATPNLNALKQFVGTIRENLAALEVQNFPIEQWSFLLTVIVQKKLDYETCLNCEKSITARNSFPDLSLLISFLENQISILQSTVDNKSKS